MPPNMPPKTQPNALLGQVQPETLDRMLASTKQVAEILGAIPTRAAAADATAAADSGPDYSGMGYF